MKIIVTKEDLDEIEIVLRVGQVTAPDFLSAVSLWEKIRLCIEKDLQLVYEEEYTESEESMAVGVITHVEKVE